MNKRTQQAFNELRATLKVRFAANEARHSNTKWEEVDARLIECFEGDIKDQKRIESLFQMEETGGAPDVVEWDDIDGYVFVDCAEESPIDRRSLCYDLAAWESRKKFKPTGNAIDTAKQMGINLLNEAQYFQLQKLGPFDTKTSSWIATTEDVRNLGGALFGDFRFGRVFIYHNGAESYYAARGFRGYIAL